MDRRWPAGIQSSSVYPSSTARDDILGLYTHAQQHSTCHATRGLTEQLARKKKKKKKGPFSSRDPVVEAVCQKGNKKKRAHLVVPFSNTG